MAGSLSWRVRACKARGGTDNEEKQFSEDTGRGPASPARRTTFPGRTPLPGRAGRGARGGRAALLPRLDGGGDRRAIRLGGANHTPPLAFGVREAARGPQG